MRQPFTDAQSALGFVISQTQNIETEVYKIRYPEFNYADLIPVITQGAAWASGTTFFTQDIVGKTEWLGDEANDAPYTDLIRDTGAAPYYTRGGGYRWSIPELNTAALLGLNLASDKAAGVRFNVERFLYDLAIAGDTEKTMKGLINWTGVTAGDVPADGSGSVTWWANKTVDQVIRDIVVGIEAIRTATNTVFTPDSLAVPTPVYSDLWTRRMGAGDGTLTLMAYIQDVLGKAYRRPFVITPLLELNAADPGADGRAVLYRRDKDVVRFHLPLPFQFLPMFQRNSFMWEQIGIVRTGGTEVRIPKAIIYLDGVWNAH